MRDIYRDMAERTGGDIYIAVAGPVRTGKSTFIKRFSELLLLPNMDDDYDKERLVDELPQSGAGRSIMTTQPRFVPAEAVNVTFEEGVSCRCKLIDCVGYMVPGAVGDREGESPRMVTTPWFDHDIPFSQAAEVGTTRVIQEHATICIVMTTDGSITDLPRESYEEAEQQAIEAAKAASKPFVVVVNSTSPESEAAQALTKDIAAQYDVTAVALDVKAMSGTEVRELITQILYAFPVKLVEISVPGFLRALSGGSPLMEGVLSMLRELSPQVQTVGDCGKLVDPRMHHQVHRMRTRCQDRGPAPREVVVQHHRMRNDAPRRGRYHRRPHRYQDPRGRGQCGQRRDVRDHRPDVHRHDTHRPADPVGPVQEEVQDPVQRLRRGQALILARIRNAAFAVV